MPTVDIQKYRVGGGHPLTLFAGPCLVEGERMAMNTAEQILRALEGLPVQYVFKASFKKANRSALSGFTGIGFSRALAVLTKVKDTFNVPIVTDVHTEIEIPAVADVADVLQIPAFLCRQTDLLTAAGRTGRVVNIKKGQFLSPEDMENAAAKVASTGNHHILLTERGTSFGYRNLVVDMRGLIIMAASGYPVVFDATHSVQIPGGEGDASGGQPQYILPLARAAIATGAVSALFMEVHPNPAAAKSDAQSQLALEKFPAVIRQLVRLYEHTATLGEEGP